MKKQRQFRCTRNVPYTNPNCPGFTDTRARQGHYIHAEDEIAAVLEMHGDYPNDLEEYRKWFKETNQPKENWSGPFTVERWD